MIALTGVGSDGSGVDFFISYAGRDRAWAEWVAWHLVEAGYTVELDAWDWAAGDNFVARMHSAVKRADRVVALFSSAYFEDERYTSAQWSSALVKGTDGGHRLVPLLVEGCPVPPLLRTLLCVELFDVDEREAVRRLIDGVRGPQRPGGVPMFPGRGRVGALTRQGERGPRLPGVLPAVWNVRPRNPGFVGRDALLVSIHEQLRSAATTVVQALHGIGGVGKTQLAIEYAYRFADFYDVVWWVNAEETSLVGEHYVALAAELGLAASHGGEANTKAAVNALRAHLRGRGRWLLVFDNAESPKDLQDWLPAGPGHTLITSRNHVWGEVAVRVEVDVLTRVESIALIHTFQRGVSGRDADQLAEALGDLPLALAQAGGFLAATGMPAGDYLRLLATGTAELLDESPPDAHPVSLAAAIRLSSDQLSRIDPVALTMARVGAFLAPGLIPTDLLTAQVPTAGMPLPAELEALAATVASPVAAHRSLGRVGRYGLARVDRGGMQLHRLTQAVLRDQVPAGQADAYRAYAEALLVASDPGEELDPASWPGWARLLPHMLAVDPATSTNPELRDLACRAAFYLDNHGDSRAARDLAHHLRRRWRERLGPDDPHALQVTSTLVGVLVDTGPYGQARRLGEENLERCRRVLGPDHSDTLQAAHVLALCLYEMGAFEEARQLNEDTLARKQRLFGKDNLACMRTAHNLARDLRALGEVEAARQLLEDIVAYRRRMLGADHPTTINAAIELGFSLRLLGEVEAARRLQEDTFALARRVLGDDHLWTMDSAKELAGNLHALGEFDAARQLGEDTLARSRRVLGDDSRFTIEAANNLAAALIALGDETAQQMSEDTFRLARRVLGEDHPHTRRAAENLAAARHAASDDRDGDAAGVSAVP